MGSNVSRWLGKALLLTVAVAAALITIHFGEGSRGIATFAAFVGATAALWALTGSPFRLPGNEVGAAYLDMPAQPMLKEYYEDAEGRKPRRPEERRARDDAEGRRRRGQVRARCRRCGKSAGHLFELRARAAQPDPVQFVEFMIPLRPDYAVHSITEQARLASGSNVGAFMKMATSVIDGALQGSAKSASSALYRSGTGSVSQIATITAGVIALSNPADIAQFSVNQVLQANSTDGGTPRAALGYVIARSV
jgi:hypothetical protein